MVTIWWTFPGRSMGRGLNGTPVQILPLVSGGAPSLRTWVRHLLDPGTSSGDTVGAVGSYLPSFWAGGPDSGQLIEHSMASARACLWEQETHLT